MHPSILIQCLHFSYPSIMGTIYTHSEHSDQGPDQKPPLPFPLSHSSSLRLFDCFFHKPFMPRWPKAGEPTNTKSRTILQRIYRDERNLNPKEFYLFGFCLSGLSRRHFNGDSHPLRTRNSCSELFFKLKTSCFWIALRKGESQN